MAHKKIGELDFFLLHEYSKSEFARLISTHYEKIIGPIDFVYDKWGKPFLRHSGKLYSSSVTNSKNVAIVAVDFAKKYFSIGIDLELKDVSDSVVKRVCSSPEQKIIEQSKIKHSDVWMAKESAVKAIGSGMGVGLRNMELFLMPIKIAADVFKISFLAKEEINGYFFYITAVNMKGVIYEN